MWVSRRSCVLRCAAVRGLAADWWVFITSYQGLPHLTTASQVGALPYAAIPLLVCGSSEAGVPGGQLGGCSLRLGLELRLFSLLSLAVMPRLFHYLGKWQVGKGRDCGLTR